MPSVSFRFDPFELQPVQRRLLRDGVPMPLRARAFDLLLVLVQRAGSLVTKADLLELVWPGLVVEENNIAAQIATLRKVVGNDLIATVAGRGYRFTADVTKAERPGSEVVTDAATSGAQTALATDPRPAANGSRLIGRGDDLVRLLASLDLAGCVTLVGPGGVGKTVLAREAASTRPFAAQAWVDLAVLADGAQLAGALYRALGIAASGASLEGDAALASTLSDGPRLVVLDNAEHVVDAVAALAATLGAIAPTLTLLVTSQVPLRIAGERVQPIEPLALPGESLSDDESAATPAVQLMIARLAAADPHRPVGADTWPLLRRLCVRLDGLPLALEMAAAMVPMLGLQGVLDALDQRFAVLRRGRRDAMPRHQTLRAAVEWSHGLLEPDAQRVFRRLAVFPDAFALDLAVAAAGDDGADRWATVDVLTELVDRSLVVRLPVDPPRFRLLETMRSFALDDLRASGDEPAVRLRAVAALTAYLREPSTADANARVAAELGHVPEFAAWARVQAPAVAIDLTLAAAAIAVWTAWLRDAATWIEACEPLLDASVPRATQALWWREFARFQSFVRGRRVVEAARKASAIERALGNDDGLFWSLIPLLRSRVLPPDEFEALRQEARTLLDRHPEWPARSRVVFSGSLAMEYRRRGDFESAWTHQQDEADEAERAGLRAVADNAQVNLVSTLIGLGRADEALDRITTLLAKDGDLAGPIAAHNRMQRINALVALGRLDEASALAPEALQWARRFDILDVFQNLARLAVLRGRVSQAAMLIGHFRHRLLARGADLPDDAGSPWREVSRVVGASFDAATVEGLMARGARMTPPELDALLVDTDDLDVRPPVRARTA